jgi:hypothetical protein
MGARQGRRPSWPAIGRRSRGRRPSPGLARRRGRARGSGDPGGSGAGSRAERRVGRAHTAPGSPRPDPAGRTSHGPRGNNGRAGKQETAGGNRPPGTRRPLAGSVTGLDAGPIDRPDGQQHLLVTVRAEGDDDRRGRRVPGRPGLPGVELLHLPTPARGRRRHRCRLSGLETTVTGRTTEAGTGDGLTATWIEVVSTTVLALAVIATTWSGYQASAGTVRWSSRSPAPSCSARWRGWRQFRSAYRSRREGQVQT